MGAIGLDGRGRILAMMAYEGPGVLRWDVKHVLAFDSQVRVEVTELVVGWQVSVFPIDFEQAVVLDMVHGPWSLEFPDGSAFKVGIEPVGPHLGSWTCGASDEWMPNGPVAHEWSVTELA